MNSITADCHEHETTEDEAACAPSVSVTSPETLEADLALIAPRVYADHNERITNTEDAAWQRIVAGATASPPSPETLTDQAIEDRMMSLRVDCARLQFSDDVEALKATLFQCRIVMLFAWHKLQAGARAQVPLPSREEPT